MDLHLDVDERLERKHTMILQELNKCVFCCSSLLWSKWRLLHNGTVVFSQGNFRMNPLFDEV